MLLSLIKYARLCQYRATRRFIEPNAFLSIFLFSLSLSLSHSLFLSFFLFRLYLTRFSPFFQRERWKRKNSSWEDPARCNQYFIASLVIENHCTSPCADLDHSSADDISINPLGNKVKPKTSLSRGSSRPIRGPFHATTTHRWRLFKVALITRPLQHTTLGEISFFYSNFVAISEKSVITALLFVRANLPPLLINPIILHQVLVAKFLIGQIYIYRLPFLCLLI